MFAETVSIVPSSILAAMNSWLTPTVFFVILNVVIATIALTSTLPNQKQHTQQQEAQPHHEPIPKPAKPPSVLQRLRSINFSIFRSQEPVFTPLNLDQLQISQETPNLETQTSRYIFRQEDPQENETRLVSRQENGEQSATHDDKTEEIPAHFGFQEAEEEEEKPGGLDGDYSESSDPHVNPPAGEIPDGLPAKMRKSASMKTPFRKFEEDDVEARRPATMRERVMTEADEEVDAKADDFINKFRQQLELQRADSILRYKGVIRRGAEI